MVQIEVQGANPEDAERFREKLSKSYVNAHIVVHEDHRGRFYRVRIGRFTSLKDAERFSDNLVKNDGFDQAFAVFQHHTQ